MRSQRAQWTIADFGRGPAGVELMLGKHSPHCGGGVSAWDEMAALTAWVRIVVVDDRNRISTSPATARHFAGVAQCRRPIVEYGLVSSDPGVLEMLLGDGLPGVTSSTRRRGLTSVRSTTDPVQSDPEDKIAKRLHTRTPWGTWWRMVVARE